MSTTDRHGFFLWSAGFTQSDVLLNDLLLKLETKLGLSVVSRTTDAQPGAPTAGDCYIITGSATGAAWAGFAEHDVAIYRDATWYAFTPIAGWPAWVEDDAEGVMFNGTSWTVVSADLSGYVQDSDFAADGLMVASDGAGSYATIKVKLDATAAPTVDNDTTEGYSVGSQWLDVTNDKAYVCLDATDGNAVWTETTGSGSGLSEAQVDARVALYAPTSGTFTPTLQDNSRSDGEGQTYSKQTGFYRKIGDLVHFWIDLRVTSLGSLTTTETAIIAGLPFTAASPGSAFPVMVGAANNVNISAGESISGLVVEGTTDISLRLWSSATGTTQMPISKVSASGIIVVSGSYITA